MKNLAFALILLICAWPLHADTNILVNSTFADGHAHWGPDAKDIDSGDLGASSTPAGAVVQLKKDKWTKIYQVFTVRDKKLYYTITFQLSNDYKLGSQDSKDHSNADLGDIPGIMWQWSLPEHCWSMLIQGGDNYTQDDLEPDRSKLGQSQTLSGHLNDLHTDVESVFLLAFPPGEGSITFSTVSLSNVDPNAQP
jgi:hypothetical protein